MKTGWIMIGADITRQNPDSRRYSYNDFNHFFQIEGETREQALENAAKHQIDYEKAADGAYSEGKTFQWAGPFEVVKTFADWEDADREDPENYWIEDMSDADTLVSSVPAYAKLVADRAAADKKKKEQQEATYRRSLERSERAQYDRLRSKFEGQ